VELGHGSPGQQFAGSGQVTGQVCCCKLGKRSLELLAETERHYYQTDWVGSLGQTDWVKSLGQRPRPPLDVVRGD